MMEFKHERGLSAVQSRPSQLTRTVNCNIGLPYKMHIVSYTVSMIAQLLRLSNTSSVKVHEGDLTDHGVKEHRYYSNNVN